MSESRGRYSRRIKDIEPFHVMHLLAQARALEAAGKDIVHMEIGEPDFPTPEPVTRAAIRAIEKGDVHYTPTLGLPQLRERIAAFYQQRYGLNVSAQRIVITPGASGALLLALGLLLDTGQQIMLADPGYPCNRNFVRFLGGEPQMINVGVDTDYQLTAALVEQHWTTQTRALMLASPSNPTGTLINEQELAAISQIVAQKDGHLIVDEIYHGLVYDDEPASALSFSEQTFVINSFSKYFGMTGWRLGWLVAPENAIPDIDKLAQNLFLAASTPAQYAALAAFEPDNLVILEQRRQQFQQRRDYLLGALRKLGFELPLTPQGAFYLYANCEMFSDDSFRFAQSLLHEAGVAVTPGRDFGDNQPQKFLRFSYTTSLARLEEGINRLQAYLVG
ncbi:Valine--pyruvate aminotransferase [hydrothermal vent metagenome]|uniref:Valine--pyruvate aminotransferase n=1 Tax=hydrothermal vent metagenome TaxID=652676 RepID=A0A3B1C9U0_9ZZZZ